MLQLDTYKFAIADSASTSIIIILVNESTLKISKQNKIKVSPYPYSLHRINESLLLAGSNLCIGGL